MKSYFHTQTLPVLTSPCLKPISSQRFGLRSSVTWQISDFLVAKTGSVPRKGEWAGYSAVVRLQDSVSTTCHRARMGLIYSSNPGAANRKCMCAARWGWRPEASQSVWMRGRSCESGGTSYQVRAATRQTVHRWAKLCKLSHVRRLPVIQCTTHNRIRCRKNSTVTESAVVFRKDFAPIVDFRARILYVVDPVSVCLPLSGY